MKARWSWRNGKSGSAALLVVQRFDRVEARGADGGIEPEHDPDEHRHAEREDDRAGGHDRRPSREYADQLRQSDAKQDAGDAAGERDDRRLDQELTDDVFLARANRAADADL